MREVAEHDPNITILLTFGYGITRPVPGEKDRSQSDYGLWSDFLDGMLSACAPATRIVDAFENSLRLSASGSVRAGLSLDQAKGPGLDG